MLVHFLYTRPNHDKEVSARKNSDIAEECWTSDRSVSDKCSPKSVGLGNTLFYRGLGAS